MEAPAQAPPGDSVAAGADLVPLHPRVRRLWWVRSALTVLWMTIIAGVVDRFAPIPLPPWTLPGVVLAVGVPLAVLGPSCATRAGGTRSGRPTCGSARGSSG